jgi:ABC-type antimicrobial peptide transport system permease subunit
VIGVAADVKYLRIDEAPRPYVYVPFLQSYRSSMILHTRGAANVERLVERARALVAAQDPDLPILSARPMEVETRGALLFYDLTAFMLFIFGVAGMALAALGTYGLVSYAVEQSTREIGIRMALGASPRDVVRLVLRDGFFLTGTGLAIGVPLAVLVSILLTKVFVDIGGFDGLVVSAATIVLGAAATIASAIPARRATRVQPLRALQGD